jgi:hypothetical protein
MRKVFVFILGLLMFGGAAAHAQTGQVRQYAAKFVCGNALKAQVIGYNFAPGSYYTSINVHYPALSGGIDIRKKFALAGANEKPGKISQWFIATLKADEAMQVDCGSIYQHLGITPGTFIDGFAVLQLPPSRELDVVGVYTVAPPGAGISSIHTERVAGRITQ